MFLSIGLVVVGVAVSMVWTDTKGNHLVLTGEILKVRSAPIENRTLIAVDFRVTNPTEVPFVIRELSMKLERFKEDPLEGVKVSKSDVDQLFTMFPALGVKTNQVLSQGETIPPGKTLERMAEATFEIPQSMADYRKGVVVHIEDVDGAGFDIAEKK